MDIHQALIPVNIGFVLAIIIVCFYVYMKTAQKVPLIIGIAFLTNFVFTLVLPYATFYALKSVHTMENIATIWHIEHTAANILFASLIIYAMLLFLKR